MMVHTQAPRGGGVGGVRVTDVTDTDPLMSSGERELQGREAVSSSSVGRVWGLRRGTLFCMGTGSDIGCRSPGKSLHL